MITIVALQYHEPYYEATRQCIAATQLPVVWVDRQGWGNFSKAMNEGVRQATTRYIWFTTDITFEPDTPYRLLEALQSFSLAAVHPHHNSDHISHRRPPEGGGVVYTPDNGPSQLVRPVPFIEWTAPLVNAEWMHQFPLDENHWYWYMDLLWSHAVRAHGGRLGVDLLTGVDHVYRRNKVEHQITRKRYRHRQVRDRIEKRLLEERFGPDWRKILWCVE